MELPLLLHKGPSSLHFAVSPSALYDDREAFYRKELSEKTLAKGITRWENPFSLDTFPMMNNINYSVMFQHGELLMPDGDFMTYEEQIQSYKEARYIKNGEKKLNNSESITEPRIYDINTSDLIKGDLDYHLENGTALVIKLVDLGNIYSENRYTRGSGNDCLCEVYNEARVGFFLNELLYAYVKIPTQHFMQVIDWFVSDTNLYPSERGDGPYQYIVSEKLDYKLYDYLVDNHHDNILTLVCTLFSVAQALEAAWHTHQYIHFDLHRGNVMLKKADEGSMCYEKDYMYIRPSKIHYRLPKAGLNNCLVKIIDFGRNRMQIPSLPGDNRDLYSHIEKNNNTIHAHTNTIKFDDNQRGVGLENNRIWDMRRLLWSMVFDFPSSYWIKLRTDTKYYPDLLTQIDAFIDIGKINKESAKHTPADIHNNLFTGKKNVQFTIEAIMCLDDTIKRSELFEKWADTVAAEVIYSKDVQESPNVETFLSSDLFASFKIQATEVNEKTGVWMGRSLSV